MSTLSRAGVFGLSLLSATTVLAASNLENKIQEACVAVTMRDLAFSRAEAELAIAQAQPPREAYTNNFVMDQIGGISKFSCQVELHPQTLELVDGYIDISFSTSEE